MKKLRKWIRSHRSSSVALHSVVPSEVYAAPGTAHRGPRRSAKVARASKRAGWVSPFKKALGFMPYLALAVACALLPIAGYHGYVALLGLPYFKVSDIQVDGHVRLSREMLVAMSGVVAGSNLLELDEGRVEERLRVLPWVKRVAVLKEIPGTVVIRVEERDPVAILMEERTWLVDGDGNIFKEMEAAEYDPNLLLVGGVRATRLKMVGDWHLAQEQVGEALAVARDYRAQGLHKRYPLVEVNYDEVSGFTLVCEQGKRFVLGFGEFPSRLERLATVLADIEGKAGQVETVRLDDERRPWRVVVAADNVTLEPVRERASAPALNQDFLP